MAKAKSRKKFKRASTPDAMRKQRAAIRRYYAKKGQAKNFSENQHKGVPLGRTLSTYDHYLGKQVTGSQKKRPVVVIERNEQDELAVVPLSSRSGKNRTLLKNYQQGESYFKHYVEIEDNEGNPIRVNEKFRENHENQDVSRNNVERIRQKVFYNSIPASENQRKIDAFRKRKKH